MRYRLNRAKWNISISRYKIRNPCETWNIPVARNNNKRLRKLIKEYIKTITRKYVTKRKEIDATGGKNQVRKEDIRINPKLFETCLMTVLPYGMETWGNIRPGEMRGKEKVTERH